MNKKKLVAGTRPAIDSRTVIMTGADGFDGYEITEYHGMTWGISVRAKDMGQDCGMVCKSISGGELDSYTSLGDESRQKAVDRMLSMAKRYRANGIIKVKFDIDGANQGASQVVVHGTAVTIEPIQDYVPTGALGNIMAEIEEHLRTKAEEK